MSSAIRRAIDRRNNAQQKALSVFLTCGYPDPHSFIELAVEVLVGGADMLELGIPFSDPIADGPMIQQSSHVALQHGMTIEMVLDFCAQIKKPADKPLILMGYANPIQQYGLTDFIRDAQNSGVDGLIVPDVPLEEYDSFWSAETTGLDIILLTTPTSSEQRISEIDERSTGFVYCVSVTGTTGMRESFAAAALDNVSRTYSIISKNRMLIGFGISGTADVKRFAPSCDGIIVGSAVIRHLDPANMQIHKAIDLVANLRKACDNPKD